MFKKALTLSLFLLLPACFVQAVTPPETLDVFTVDNLAIVPQDISGSIATSSTIDLRFSGPVSVSLDILSDSNSLVRHIYNSASVTNPDPKVWLGKDTADAFVADGIYTVQVVYISAGVTATDTTKTITVSSPVVDTTAPVITLLGEAIVNLLVGDTYTDAGVTVVDDIDGDITASTTITGLPVDTSIAGDYTVSYNVSDSAGNPAIEVTRSVTVSPAPSRTSSGGYAPGWGPDGFTGVIFQPVLAVDIGTSEDTEGQVLGASTSRMSEAIRQKRLTHFRRRLLEIKRELLLLEHPELRDKLTAEGLVVVPTTTPDITSTTSTSTDPVKKPFWKFW